MLSLLPTQCTYYAIPLIVLLGLYPFAKRVTNYPQVVLGFPVAWGLIMGSTALGVDPFGSPSAVMVATGCFYASNIAWTIIYDTIYAHQDVKDDAKAGVKSIAVRHKDSTKLLLSGLAVAQVSLLTATGVLTGAGPVYFAGTCGSAAASLAIMISKVDLEKPSDCSWWFVNGTWFVGLGVAGGLFGEYIGRLSGLYQDDSHRLKVEIS